MQRFFKEDQLICAKTGAEGSAPRDGAAACGEGAQPGGPRAGPFLSMASGNTGGTAGDRSGRVHWVLLPSHGLGALPTLALEPAIRVSHGIYWPPKGGHETDGLEGLYIEVPKGNLPGGFGEVKFHDL